ncbi:baseplate J/gp47 family protein [Lysinibacillus sp. 54212]|uniref:baseplate J/gp47 family protein n=1 Tax=Lysinibacillus sp. 54212 TaxID=3119829 RepID=UPI002FC9E798
MVRKKFTPVFEENESTIRDRVLSRVDDSWRKEPGDFVYDTVATVPEEIKQLQVNQDTILKNGHAQYAEEEYLDLLLAEVGLKRNAATTNKRTLSVTADAGVRIEAGHTASAIITDSSTGDPIEYTVDVLTEFATNSTLNVNITALEPGTMANLATGTEITFVPPIAGIRSIVDLGTYEKGTDKETDESAYARYEFKVNNPDTGGNKNDYRTWVLGVAGVGDCRVIPRWNGNNTVKVVIVDAEKKPASPSLVEAVQTYLDPGSTGLGEGKAPCGAQVTVVSATALEVNISANVTYTAGYDPAAVKKAFEAMSAEYITSLAFTDTPLVYNKEGALLISTPGVSNYSDLLINGATADISPAVDQVCVLGTVTI